MDEIKRIKTKNIKVDPLAERLSNSDEMRPYIEYFVAAMKGLDTTSALRTIHSLPADRRYLARVLSHLDLALSDLDTETARLDVKTLSADRILTMVDEFRFRHYQLTLLVDSLAKNLADSPTGGKA